MSREQLTDQQVQVGGVESHTAAPEQTRGLPPHVYAQVMGLGPEGAPALADLLLLYPSLSVRILTVAAPQVGNAAVQRAITLAQSKSSTQGKAGTLSQAEMHEIVDEPAAARPQEASWRLNQAEMHAIADEPAAARPQEASWRLNQAEMHAIADEPAAARPQEASWRLNQAEMHAITDEPAAARPQGASWRLNQAEMHAITDEPAAATKPSAEPAWVGGARKYNEAHAEFVSDFNELTNDSCLDAGGQLDPQAVARWQRQHGVEADGKVGPHTLAAARQAQAKAGPAGVATDRQIPV